MKLIFAPKVRLIGKTTFLKDEFDDFLREENVVWESDGTSDAEVISEVAGRVCYMSFKNPRPGGNAAYLQHIKECGHGNVAEHPVWNFLITGVSRSLTHELVRHRSGASPSQLSQRFVDESDTSFCVPPALQDEARAWIARQKGEPADDLMADAGGILIDALSKTKSAYGWLATYLEMKLRQGDARLTKTELRKSAREAARCVLPNATETKLVFSLNARAARHVIEMRASPHADKEIRALAYALWVRLRADSPNLFGDYEPVEHADGSRSVTTPYRKV